MVELQSNAETVLCITYDEFRSPTGASVTTLSLRDHEANVAKLTVVGLLTWLGERPAKVAAMNARDKQALHGLAHALLGDVGQGELRAALHSLRNFSQVDKDIWNDNRWALAGVLSAINIAAGGPGGGTLPPATGNQLTIDPAEAIDSLARLTQATGLSAVYVLVDRIDETEETNSDTEAAYRLISPLIHELHLLEHRPFAFKFFVPEYIYPLYQEHKGRSDRVTTYHTEWRNQELEEMLSRRLSAFSNGRVKNWEDILDPDQGALMKFMALGFAAGSPRDLIRILGRAIDEQIRIDAAQPRITLEALAAAIDFFSNEKAREIVPASILGVLRRLERLDFTVTELANDVLRVQTNAARARVQSWEKAGVITQIGDIPAARGRPHHHYGIVDLRVARALLPDYRLFTFFSRKVRLCQNCDAWTLGDWDDGTSRTEICIRCGSPLVPFQDTSR